MSAVDDDPPEPTPAFDSVVGRMEAQLSRGRPSGAVEAPARAVSGRVAAARPSAASVSTTRGFVEGVATGVAALATMVQLWLAYELAPLQQTYTEFQARPPVVSRLAASAAWRYGAVVVLVALLAGAYRMAPRRRWPLIAVAALAVVSVVFTYFAARLPLYALGGAIRGE